MMCEKERGTRRTALGLGYGLDERRILREEGVELLPGEGVWRGSAATHGVY